MALLPVLNDLNNALSESMQLAANAHIWATYDWVTLNKSLDQIQKLANDAINNPDTWKSLSGTSINLPTSIPEFKSNHKELVTKFAFFQCFLSWESFLEKTFILFLLGVDPPTGNPIPRNGYSIPSSRQAAERLSIPPWEQFADWTRADKVITNASRFFRSGGPYQVLNRFQTDLRDVKIIRNAVAHTSKTSQENFKNLVRSKIGRFPPGLTIGGFLAMPVPALSPPTSYLEYYTSIFTYLAPQIVPT